MKKEQHNQKEIEQHGISYPVRNTREMKMFYIRNTCSLFIIALQFILIKHAYSQDFNDYERGLIVNNIKTLIVDDFVNNLDLNDGSDPEDYRPNNSGKQAFKNVFPNPVQNNIIPFFAFNPDSVNAMRSDTNLTGNLSPQEYIEYFSGLYDYGFFDESIIFINPNEIERVGDINYITPNGLSNDRHQDFLNYIDNLDFLLKHS